MRSSIIPIFFPCLNMMIGYDDTLDDSDVELFDELSGMHIGFTSDEFNERMMLISDGHPDEFIRETVACNLR